MLELAFDVITHILSLSPVESILRFRCVSLKWCALIDSPYFVKKHLNRSNKNLTLILSDLERRSENKFLYSLKTSFSFIRQNTTTPSSHYKPIPVNDHPYEFYVYGSCNGLLLLKFQDILLLFNPSTRQHRRVPLAPRCRHYYSGNFGLGYDSVNDDYKIIGVIQGNKDGYDAKVYSLKSNLWRNMPYSHYINNGNCLPIWGAQVSGAIHMIVTECFDPWWPIRIVAFDVANTNFYLVPTIDLVGKIVVRTFLNVLGGCLCLLCSYRDYVDVWVMKVYQMKESWTKLFSIPSPNSVYTWVGLVGYSESCDEVLFSFTGNKLIWYDLKRMEIKNDKVSHLLEMYNQGVFVESLIPLDGYGGSSDPRSKLRKRKKRNQ